MSTVPKLSKLNISRLLHEMELEQGWINLKDKLH